ncbi:MAG: helix-turn-helix domain-containing protein [Treponema sp.]|jgi:excisionase family DNA binding protein|nr:helix-turn-helix domain-containing protein [Treponema sp.]
MEKLFTRKEAGKILRVSVESVDRCRRKGILPFHKIGNRVLFTESDLKAFLGISAYPAIEGVA